MRIVMTHALANRHVGERVELDEGSAEWLIDQKFAEPADEDQAAERAPRKRRAKPTKATATPPTAPRVGDDPPPGERSTGTS